MNEVFDIMITPQMATIIILCFIGLFGIVLPILDKVPVIRNFISFRWSIIIVFLAMMLGALLDFSHLSDSFRITLCIGVMILSGAYILIRSYEKVAANGWSLNINKLKVEKGDIKAELDLSNEKNEVEK